MKTFSTVMAKAAIILVLLTIIFGGMDQLGILGEVQAQGEPTPGPDYVEAYTDPGGRPFHLAEYSRASGPNLYCVYYQSGPTTCFFAQK